MNHPYYLAIAARLVEILPQFDVIGKDDAAGRLASAELWEEVYGGGGLWPLAPSFSLCTEKGGSFSNHRFLRRVRTTTFIFFRIEELRLL